MQKIYIVTGANGFLGNNLVRKLTENPKNQVRALVSSLERAEALRGLKCEIFAGDVTKPETLQEIFTVPDDAKVYVIHCAAIVYIKSKPNPAVYQVNVGGTRNVAEKTLEIGAKLVYVSSVHALPVLPDGEVMTEIKDFDPAKVEGEYAKSKAEAARYVLEMVEQRGLDACIVHPSGIIGPHDYNTSHLTQMIKDVMEGKLRIGVKGGYDFVDVRDVVAGILAACEKGQAGECYLLTGHYASVPELLNLVTKAAVKPAIKTYFPVWMAKMVAPLAEIYYDLKKQKPLYTKESVEVLSENGQFSHAKAERELGYTARPLAETIKDTVEWLEEVAEV